MGIFSKLFGRKKNDNTNKSIIVTKDEIKEIPIQDEPKPIEKPIEKFIEKPLPKPIIATPLDNKIEYLNEQEKTFFEAFFSLLKEKDVKNIELNRMSNKTINVQYKCMQIGRIKLYGRKTRIQLLSKNSCEWIHDLNLNEYISYINIWIKYLKYLKNSNI